MTIPDPVVYSSLPILLGFSVWVGQRFIQETVSRFRRDNKTNATAVAVPRLSIADFNEIASLLKQELNGRYMFATEARERFLTVERKMDHQYNGLKTYMLATLSTLHSENRLTLPPSDDPVPALL